MEEHEAAEARSGKQAKRKININKTVRNQLFTILLLSVSAIAMYFLPYLLGRVDRIDTPLNDLFVGLSADLLVAVVIFLFLEKNIKTLHPISELDNLPLDDFIEDIKTAKRIKILDTWTPLISIDGPQEHQAKFQAAVKQALQGGARIEVLLFHPESQVANQRAAELPGMMVIEQILHNVAWLYNFPARHALQHAPGSLEVRLYSGSPNITMYMWDDWAYVSIFPLDEPANEKANLKVPMGNPFGRMAREKFEELKKGSKAFPTVGLASYMNLYLDAQDSREFYFFYDQKQHAFYVSSLHHTTPLLKYIREEDDRRKEKEQVTFWVNGRMFVGRPREVIKPEALAHIKDCLERRYEWTPEETRNRVGVDPFIVCFEDAREMTIDTQGFD